jgi:hypothetical protein
MKASKNISLARRGGLVMTILEKSTARGKLHPAKLNG